MICGVCGSASENETLCPGCGAEVSAQADRRDSAAPSQDSLPIVDTNAPKCPQHPTMGAGATCRRCGRFVCSRCSEEALRRETMTCPECVVVEARLLLPEQLRRYGSQLIASWLTVAGTLGALLVGMAVSMEQDKATLLGVTMLLGPCVVVLLLATVVFAATRKLFIGWAATVMEWLTLVPLLVTNPSWCTAVLVVAPIFATLRLLQMKELHASA